LVDAEIGGSPKKTGRKLKVAEDTQNAPKPTMNLRSTGQEASKARKLTSPSG
jgi:hypothetical protein